MGQGDSVVGKVLDLEVRRQVWFPEPKAGHGGYNPSTGVAETDEYLGFNGSYPTVFGKFQASERQPQNKIK